MPVNCVLCSVLCVLCTVLCALCSVVCSVLCALVTKDSFAFCTLHYYNWLYYNPTSSANKSHTACAHIIRGASECAPVIIKHQGVVISQGCSLMLKRLKQKSNLKKIKTKIVEKIKTKINSYQWLKDTPLINL